MHKLNTIIVRVVFLFNIIFCVLICKYYTYERLIKVGIYLNQFEFIVKSINHLIN